MAGRLSCSCGAATFVQVISYEVDVEDAYLRGSFERLCGEDKKSYVIHERNI